MRWSAVGYGLMGFLLVGAGFAAGQRWQLNAENPLATKAPHESAIVVAKNDGAARQDLNSAAQNASVAPPISATAKVSVLFSPEDNIQQALIGLINNAQRNILVQAYLLTDDRIADALIRAHKRGVNVEVLLDSQVVSDAKGSDGIRLYEAGIPVRLETRYDHAHNKIMIFDHDTANAAVATGSYNYTVAAQKNNAENVVIIRQSAEMIRRYVDNWQKHAEESIAYAGNPVS